MYIFHNNILTAQSMAKLHRHKKSHCEIDPHNNSVLGVEHQRKIILSTEHQYKNNFVTPKQRKILKETNSETIFFFTVTDVDARDTY